MQTNLKPDITSRSDFRRWLTENHDTASEVWVCVRRGKPNDEAVFWYLDAVEEALCFGWIDSTNKLVDGVRMQRFSPRKKNSLWTELNKERVRRLEKLGLMTEAGRAVLPDTNVDNFKPDEDIVAAMKKKRVWTKFCSFPPLYQRIRAYNVAFYKKRDKEMFDKSLLHLIDETRKGRMFGEWNDCGRLIDY